MSSPEQGPLQVVALDREIALRHLYFTSTSITSDDKTLVVIGELGGIPDLYSVDLATGAKTRLTAHTEAPTSRMDGVMATGFSGSSVTFDPDRAIIYYLHGQEVRAVDLQGNLRVLAHLPDGQATAGCHVSGDGRLLCVPTTDIEAFTHDAEWDSELHGIDARVQRLGLSSYLRIFDTATGEEVISEQVPRAWISHVQFHPHDARQILYNHEWPGDCGIRRVWLWDGVEHRALRTIGDGRSKDDWTCHEMWERDGNGVVYHGRYVDGRCYLGRAVPAENRVVEITLPDGWSRYGHFSTGLTASDVATDGYFRRDDSDSTSPSPWMSSLKVDWEAGTIDWRVIGRTDSSWNRQDTHPHPIFDHAGKHIYFTSDRDGLAAVYRIALDEKPVFQKTV